MKKQLMYRLDEPMAQAYKLALVRSGVSGQSVFRATVDFWCDEKSEIHRLLEARARIIEQEVKENAHENPVH